MAKTPEAMPISDASQLPDWDFLDLQKKKQTGEIYKKISSFYNSHQAQIFSFTSCRENEGVTTILMNLVQHMKRLNIDKKVLIVDANLQAPRLHSIFHLNNDKGLTDILSGSIGFSEAIQTIGTDNIHVLLSGKDHEKLSGNIQYEIFNDIFSSAKKQYDYILIDSSPILTSPDFLPSAEVSDIVFLVLQSIKVQREAALKAKTLLLDNECVIGGVILNRVQQVIPEWLYRVI